MAVKIILCAFKLAQKILLICQWKNKISCIGLVLILANEFFNWQSFIIGSISVAQFISVQCFSMKQKIVHGGGPSNIHLGIFVCSLDIYQTSKPFPH